MAIEQLEYCTAETNVIASLTDKPNSQSGMTAAQLKAKFDAADAAIKAYINNTLVPYINKVLHAAIEAPAADVEDGIITTEKLASGLLVPLANGGTGNTDGLAQAAKKLETARTIQTDLSGNSAASFDGTDNVTPGVTGILPIEKGGTGASSAGVALYALTPKNYPSPSFVLSLDAAGHIDGGGFTTLDQLQAALGVVSIAKLWENASPTSAFGIQTVSLDLSGYQMVLMLARVSTNYDEIFSNITPVGSAGRISGGWGNSDEAFHRDYEVSTTGIYFYGAYAQGGYDASDVVPTRIYGIKGVT